MHAFRAWLMKQIRAGQQRVRANNVAFVDAVSRGFVPAGGFGGRPCAPLPPSGGIGANDAATSQNASGAPAPGISMGVLAAVISAGAGGYIVGSMVQSKSDKAREDEAIHAEIERLRRHR